MAVKKVCDNCGIIIPDGTHYRLDVLVPRDDTNELVDVVKSLDLHSQACIAESDKEPPVPPLPLTVAGTAEGP